MAKTANNFRELRLDNDERGLYWMTVRRFAYMDDISGHEFIELQTEIRSYVAQIQTQLKEHDIDIANVATQQHLDYRALGSRVAVAIGFRSKEELALTKLILKCDELD